MKKKLFVLLLSIISVVCLTFGVSACSKTKTDDVAVTSVSISTTEISLEVGESYTLSATILPSNATNTNVTWSSSATSVATVSGGKVTAISEGTAVITVTTTDGGYTDTCTVTVTETQETPSTVSVTSVSLSETSLSLEAGGTYTLTATVLPSDATDKTVSWSSSDESVAAVSNGVITAVAAGTATITVTTTDGNYTATCELTITEEPETVAVTSVSLNTNSLSLTVGGTSTLTATVLPSNATNQNVTWSSSDNSICAVSDGTITAISTGTATITVTTTDGNYTAECFVTIEEETPETVAVTSVSLNTNSLSLTVGGSSTLTATISPSNATNQNVAWSSSNTSVATVNNGTVTAIAAGTATVTVTTADGGYTAECDISVAEKTAAVLSVNNATINGSDIYLFTDYTTTSISLSGAVACSDNSSWKLYSSDGITEIPTKVITSLADGTNTYFIVVTSTLDSNVSNTYILTVYKSFAVTVSYYDGSSVIYNETAYTGYEFTTNYIPDITGYIFNKWTYSDGTAFTSETLWADLKLYAAKTANNYTVTYNVDGGSMNEIQITVTYNSSYSFEVPARDGYTFNGWYYGETQLTNSNGESIFVWNYATDITVTAKWTANNYTITLNLSDSDAGNVTGGGNYAYDSDVTISATTNDGYTWVGWYNENGELVTTETTYSFTMGFAVTYTAVWTANTYTVTLELSDNNAGTVSGDGSHIYNSSVTISSTTNEGYTWDGWYNSENELITTETSYTFTMGFAVTYTAKWSINAYTVTIELSDDSAGSVTGSGTYDYNSEVTITATTNSGYTWVGWYNGDTQVSSELSYIFTMPAKNVTYTAVWTYYTLTTSVNDENAGSVTEYSETKVTTGEEVIITATTNNGYTWVGWYNGDTQVSSELSYIFTMPAKNVTYTAVWTYYTLTTSVNEENAGSVTEYTEIKVTVGEEVTITATTNNGYTWVGWYNGDTQVSSELNYTFSMPAENIIYTAKWSKTTLSINDNSAGSISTLDDTYTVGNTVTISTTDNLGYTLIGWYKNDSLYTTDYSFTYALTAENTSFIAYYEVDSELSNFVFTSTTTTCEITGIIDNTVTEIAVPDYVTTISKGAFSGCSSLVSITLPFVGSSASATKASASTLFGYIFGTSNFDNSTLTSQIYSNSSSSWTTITGYYIPTSLTTVTVTGGDIFSAFSNCALLTSITIPNNVTSIWFHTFYGCSSLANVNISNNIASIMAYAFYECTSLVNMPISNNVTSIGYRAFYGCTSLESITIPKNMTSISHFAFYNCTALTKIYFYATELEDLSFEYPIFYSAGQSGDGITVIIGANVTKIPAYLFYTASGSNCISKIVSVIFEDNSVCTSIGNGAFYNCTSLSSVYYSGTVSEWASISFGNITSNPLYYAGNLYIKAVLLTDLNDMVLSTINEYTFAGWNITSITIPNNITSIGESAFNGCASLESIIIPDSVTIIGDLTFYNCSSLESITIPNSINSIGSAAFGGCSSLVSITMPFVGSSASATNASRSTLFGYIFGESSYDGGTSTKQYYASSSYTTYYIPATLTTVTITGGNILYGTFYNCTLLESITLPDDVTSIGDYVFYGCTSLESITLPNDVTSIGNYVFYGCTSLTSITIPDNVTSIGNNAFYGCTSLESITLPNDVTSIGNYVFYGCTSLTSITIPDNVTSIGNNAFYGCTSLESVTIGSGVTSIGSNAFSNCTLLGNIIVDSSNTYYKSIDGNLYSYDGTELIQYSVNREDTSFVIPEGVKSIGSNAFRSSSSLTSITIPDSVTSIGSYAFYNCTTKIIWGDSPTIAEIGSYAFAYYMGTSITIPDSVETIGIFAFYDCTSLVSVTMGSNVTSIGSVAFDGCISLTSIIIPDSVASIDNQAFYDCISLVSVTIGSRVTSIGDSAFSGCSSLESITIPNSVTSIGNCAFYGCTSLTSVTIGSRVTSIGIYAFYGCSSLTSVTFENTSGWYVTTTEGATSGTTISSTYVEKVSTMATYLKSTYYKYYWYRK